VRERFFTPRLRVSSYEELNALLLDRCVAYAKAHKHPEIADRTIWQAFEAERAHLVPIVAHGSTGRFDGFHSVTCLGLQDLPGSLSTTTSTRSPRVPSAGRSRSRPMPIASSSARTGRSSASTPAVSAAAEACYDPWHYVPVLARKPGALRNGAPFKDWVLPANLERVRRKLRGSTTATGRW
jgi:hypothetical protein